MSDKFKKGDIVEFKKEYIHEVATEYRNLSGKIMKAFHSRKGKKPTAYLIMTDYEIVGEDKLRLKE